MSMPKGPKLAAMMRTRRDRLGWTQDQVAEALTEALVVDLRIDRELVSGWERARYLPRTDKYLAIAHFLETDVQTVKEIAEHDRDVLGIRQPRSEPLTDDDLAQALAPLLAQIAQLRRELAELRPAQRPRRGGA